MQVHAPIRTATFWMAVFPVFGLMANPPTKESTSLYSRLIELNIQLRDKSGERRSAAIISTYRELAAGSSVCSRPIADTAIADDFFRANAFAEFYSLAEADVDTLGCLYRELLTDGRATDWHTRTYAGALVTVARFDDANRLLAQVEGGHAGFLPHITSASSLTPSGPWRYLSMDENHTATIGTWTPVAGHLQVIAVVHPACAFSTRALTDIESNEDLRWLRESLLLLVPPDPSLPGRGILDWNNAHPDLSMKRMYTWSDWQQLTRLDTPTFYLMQGDHVVQTFEGWPNAEGIAQIRAALTR